MGRIDMTYDEVKRRMKNGATAQVIADLNGVTVQAVNAFIKRNKEAEAGLPEPEYLLGHNDKNPKLLVDKDVIEKIEGIRIEIDKAIEEYSDRISELEDKRKQFNMILDLLGVRE